MSSENGKVIVETTIAGLGVVRGIKTLGELSGQTPPPVAEKAPAVQTRPLPDQAASGTARPTSAGSSAPAGSETASSSGSDAPPASASADAEAKAQRVLNLARAYIKAGMTDKAVAKLREVTATYPGTDAAKAAVELLGRYR